MLLKPAALLLLVILATASAATGAAHPTITSAAELVDVLRDYKTVRTPYDLTGTVIAVTPQDFILNDASGRFNFLCSMRHPVSPGDIVRVTGTIGKGNSVWKPVPPHDVVRLGATNVPSATVTDIPSLAKGLHPLQLVTVEGQVKSVFRDDIDATNVQLYLWENGKSLLVSLPAALFPLTDLVRRQGARIRATGICYPYRPGKRMFRGLFLRVRHEDDFVVLTPPPADPFDFPLLRDIHREVPETILSLGRQRTSGHVLASWQDDRFLLQAVDGQKVGVLLADGETQPQAGEAVDVVGDPETDLFRINLSGARVRPSPGLTNVVPNSCATEADPSVLLLDTTGHASYQAEHHGQVFRLSGTVRSLPSPDDAHAHLTLVCGRFPVTVDASTCPEAFAELEIGCRAAITGVCIFDCANWRPATPFPRIADFMLVVRTPADVRLLARAPWWTPGRLLAVICSLFALLVAFLVWNRMLNHIVTRRSHELLRERLAHASATMKVDERTRLAVELHDALSQNLAGVACQLAVAKDAVAEGPETAVAQLETAERMLQSSRTELKRCLWDLRGDALEERDFAKAIVRTLSPLVGTAAVDVRFDVSRARLSDTTAHALLCIIRELVTNALRHGQAHTISVSGGERNGVLAISVKDDGCGFDVLRAQGPDQGHFGLEGIRERLKRMGGTFDLTSAVSAGTKAVVTIPLSRNALAKECP